MTRCASRAARTGPLVPAIAVLLAAQLVLVGCAAQGPTTVTIPPGRYTHAFDAARDALSAQRFVLDRVDVRAGVITTARKPSAGLATPWDTQQTTLAQEAEDLLNQQERRIRVVFESPDAQAGPTTDLRASTQPLTARVEVVVDRVRRTGWVLEPTAVRASARVDDPGLVSRGVPAQFVEPVTRDDALAARLARQIQRAIDTPQPPAHAPHPARSGP